MLDVGETWVYSATHVVTQAEMDGGTALHNIATVTTNHTSAQSDDATTTISQQPSLTIAKDVTESSATAAGETLHYTITVHNTGNIDLSSVAISDALNGSGLSVPATPASGDASDVGVLDVGETWVYSATHVVTQAEMDGGTALHNIATVTTNHTSAQSDDATTTISQQPSLTIAKDVTESSATAAGETLHYTITVHNTGNIDLSSVAISDALNGSGLSVPATPASGDASDVGVLDVGETWVYSATHVVTQAEMDGGTALHNIATVTTNHTSAQSDDATTTISQQPSLTVDKTADVSHAAEGDVIHYTITVHNTGNIDLTNVMVTDSLDGGPGVNLGNPVTHPADVTVTEGDAPPLDTTLNVGETWTYTYSHTVNAADLNTIASTGWSDRGKTDHTTVPVVSANGALIFAGSDVPATGTGLIQSFLRLQDVGDGKRLQHRLHASPEPVGRQGGSVHPLHHAGGHPGRDDRWSGVPGVPSRPQREGQRQQRRDLADRPEDLLGRRG